MDMIDNETLGVRHGTDSVTLERLLPGPIERVWAYLTEPEKRRTWFGGGAFELRPGGKGELRFRHQDLTDEAPPEKYRHVHEVGVNFPVTILKCEAPRLLAITWPCEGGKESQVTFSLAVEGEKVRLTITHSRLPDIAEMINVSGGWHIHTAILLAKLEGRESPPFWSRFAELEDRYRVLLSAQ